MALHEDGTPDQRQAHPIEMPAAAVDPFDAVSCATGILMERYGCDAEAAAQRLADWSRDTAIDVPLVAAWLIDDISAIWRRNP
ncbi:ANTAR domain-containing protein [Actinomycetospora flava]|uniref:ANTAR domain-containing protein n=1 Tax=Actinomycetospora flava TaxID=3129232 RepID=A0ABU8M273_9PSEU